MNTTTWATIENIATLIVIGLLFYFTQSGWCFLLLLNMNSIKTTIFRKPEDKPMKTWEERLSEKKAEREKKDGQ